jgi:hypothetical protein
MATAFVWLKAGTSGTINQITVDGTTLLAAPVAFNTDLRTTAVNTVAAINSGPAAASYHAEAPTKVTDAHIHIFSAAGSRLLQSSTVLVVNTTGITTSDSYLLNGGILGENNEWGFPRGHGGTNAIGFYVKDASSTIIINPQGNGPKDRIVYESATAQAASIVLRAPDFNWIGGGIMGTAPLDNPAFTGNPTAPTPGTADADTSIATTAYVQNNLASYANKSGVAFTGAVSASQLTANAGVLMVDRVGDAFSSQVLIRGDAGFSREIFFQTGTSGRWALRADSTAEGGSNAGTNFSLFAYDDTGVSLGSIFVINRSTRVFAYTVSPTAPTPTAGDNTTKLSTTAFVQAALGFYTTTTSLVANYAPLASPALTGTPTAPTPTAGDNSTKLATTAFIAASFEKFGTRRGLNTQTGTTYTFVLGDAGQVVEGNNAAAQTYTVPPNSSVAYPVGSWIDVSQYGAGQITIAPGSGVTLRSAGTLLKTRGQYSGITLVKRGTDEWYVFGDLG